jgi:hypothetical protein
MNYTNSALIILLTCVFVPINIAQAQLNVSPEMQKLLDARDDKRCQQIGAKQGTDVYVMCRLQLMQAREKSYAPIPQQPMKRLPAPFVFKPYQLPPPPHLSRRSTNCTSRWFGGTLFTDCQ